MDNELLPLRSIEWWINEHCPYKEVPYKNLITTMNRNKKGQGVVPFITRHYVNMAIVMYTAAKSPNKMETTKLIDLLTLYRYFAGYDSVEEVKKELPNMWGTKRKETENWLGLKKLLNEKSGNNPS